MNTSTKTQRDALDAAVLAYLFANTEPGTTRSVASVAQGIEDDLWDSASQVRGSLKRLEAAGQAESHTWGGRSKWLGLTEELQAERAADAAKKADERVALAELIEALGFNTRGSVKTLGGMDVHFTAEQARELAAKLRGRSA